MKNPKKNQQTFSKKSAIVSKIVQWGVALAIEPMFSVQSSPFICKLIEFFTRI